MSFTSDRTRCNRTEVLFDYVLQALPASDVPDVEDHLGECPDCQQEMEMLRPIADSFVAWPTDVLRPATSLWGRLAERIAAETGAAPMSPPPARGLEPDWEQVAPGISCKLLATDTVDDRVSMLVRLAPGAAYPPHVHAGVEELHLLDGELVIDDRKLYPGDYNRGEPGEADELVWSETGCTCVLLTSFHDMLL